MSKSINDLPDELLLIIFRHFDVVELSYFQLVCRRWSSLTLKAFSDVKSLSTALTENLHIFRNILRLCGLYLNDLSLDLEDQILYGMISTEVIWFCDPTKLKALYLRKIGFNRDFLDIVGHFSGLATLSLVSVKFRESTDDDDFVSSIIRRCSHLQNLSIKGHHNLTGTFLHSLQRSLIKFTITDCNIAADALPALLQHDLHLEFLDLEGCFAPIDDLVYICQNGTNLKHLNLNYCRFRQGHTFYDDFVPAIGRLLNLRHFHASGWACDRVIEILNLNRQNLTNLRSICIGPSTGTDFGIVHLFPFTHLTQLDISGMANIHDWSLIQLALAGMNQLVKLFCCHCTNLIGTFLKTFLERCPNLVMVGFKECSLVSNSAITECLDVLEDRGKRFTLCVGNTNISVANLIVNDQFRKARLHLDWSECDDHEHQ